MMKYTAGLLAVTIISLLPGCGGPAKEENDASASSLFLHAGDEKYVDINTKESIVHWKGANAFGAHSGYVYFTKGELLMENGQLAGGAVEIDMNTLEDESHRKSNGLIDHLKNPDFFDVKKFPFSTLVITRVTSLNDANQEITGNLTIKGITRAVTFPANIEVKDGIIRANGKLTIDRTLWDVRYNSGKFYDNLADEAISDSIEFIVKIVARQDKDGLAGLAQDSLLEAAIAQEIASGEIYKSTSPHHNLLHQFTHLVATRDFCAKRLLQIRVAGELNKELAKALKRELLNARSALTAAKFKDLKIEAELYEVFLKQINDKFIQLHANEC